MVMICTALAVLATAAVASAAPFNRYTAVFHFSPNKTGSLAKPVPIGFTEDFTAKGIGGNRTAALTDITTVLYGLRSNGGAFPTCTLATIAAAKRDTICPKGSLVATGYITAVLGAEGDQKAAPVGTCDPELHAWNGGQGKLVFFFVDTPTHLCLNGALTTGSVGPYLGTIRQIGGAMVTDTPIPTAVSFPLHGLEGSLLTEHLKFANNTTKVHGKTVGATEAIGCKNGKRPYSTAFTSEMNNRLQTGKVPGVQKCSK
jgi:hypothetical protein